MCRSPIAEGLLKHILKLNGIIADVDSAGFEVFHINETPDYRAIEKAKEKGLDISEKRVRLFTEDDFDKFDKIYVMDTLAYRNALYFARTDEHKNKIDFLMNIISPGKNESVPDPFFRDLEACEQTFDILEEACEKIANNVLSQPLN
jgi:protein-tyrosine phosphatase